MTSAKLVTNPEFMSNGNAENDVSAAVGQQSFFNSGSLDRNGAGACLLTAISSLVTTAEVVMELELSRDQWSSMPHKSGPDMGEYPLFLTHWL